jgi:hypothetical protein
MRYVELITDGRFPDREHSYAMSAGEEARFTMQLASEPGDASKVSR